MKAIYLASLALHVVVGTAVAATRPPQRPRAVAVEVRRVRRRAPPPPPPPAPAPTPAPAPVAAPAARAQAPRSAPAPARPAPSRPAPSSARAAPSTGGGVAVGGAHDFGVAMGNEGTAGGSGDGQGAAAPASPAPTPRAAHDADECAEAATRPRVVSLDEPEYPEAAREEGIEGRVRVEIRVDAEGRVVGARVLEGLGHGLDESALAAARAARFEPATRCGRPVDATFTVGIRFAL